MGKARSGAKNPNWKGGRSVASNGYVLIRVGVGHHLADVRGYAYEHRLVAEKKLGRRLRQGEVVHHKDEDQQNNDEDNLTVVASAAHHRLEHRHRTDLRHPDERNPVIRCACGCGRSFRRYDESGRPRRFLSGHNRHPAPTQAGIYSALKQGGPLSRDELARRVGLRTRVVALGLTKLKRRGLVTNLNRGVWGVLAHG